jgi:hypothetical protein
MPLLDFIPRRKEKPKFVFTPKVIFRPRYEPLRKLFTDARKKLKAKITSEKALLKFFKEEREQVIKAIKEEKVPKKLKLLRKQRNLLRTLIVNKAVRKEFLRRVVVKEKIVFKKVKIRVRAYTRMFKGKKVRVRAHTRTIKKKVRITKTYLKLG